MSGRNFSIDSVSVIEERATLRPTLLILRGWRGNPWEFESPLWHHRNTQRELGQPPPATSKYRESRIFRDSLFLSGWNICSFVNRSFKMSVRPRVGFGSNPVPLVCVTSESHICSDDLAVCLQRRPFAVPCLGVAFFVGALPRIEDLARVRAGELRRIIGAVPRVFEAA